MIVPGTIPGWKAPPVARVALFEPHERFIDNENQIAQDALFSFEKGIVSITVANTNDEVLTIYKDTALCFVPTGIKSSDTRNKSEAIEKLQRSGSQVRLGKCKESD